MINQLSCLKPRLPETAGPASPCSAWHLSSTLAPCNYRYATNMSESWCVLLTACGQLNSNAKEIFVVGFSSPPIITRTLHQTRHFSVFGCHGNCLEHIFSCRALNAFYMLFLFCSFSWGSGVPLGPVTLSPLSMFGKLNFSFCYVLWLFFQTSYR